MEFSCISFDAIHRGISYGTKYSMELSKFFVQRPLDSLKKIVILC